MLDIFFLEFQEFVIRDECALTLRGVTRTIKIGHNLECPNCSLNKIVLARAVLVGLPYPLAVTVARLV